MQPHVAAGEEVPGIWNQVSVPQFPLSLRSTRSSASDNNREHLFLISLCKGLAENLEAGRFIDLPKAGTIGIQMGKLRDGEVEYLGNRVGSWPAAGGVSIRTASLQNPSS